MYLNITNKLDFTFYRIKRSKRHCMFSTSGSFQDVSSETKEISKHNCGPGPRLRPGLGSLFRRSGLTILIIKTITVIITVMDVSNAITIIVIILYIVIIYKIKFISYLLTCVCQTIPIPVFILIINAIAIIVFILCKELKF